MKKGSAPRRREWGWGMAWVEEEGEGCKAVFSEVANHNIGSPAVGEHMLSTCCAMQQEKPWLAALWKQELHVLSRLPLRNSKKPLLSEASLCLQLNKKQSYACSFPFYLWMRVKSSLPLKLWITGLTTNISNSTLRKCKTQEVFTTVKRDRLSHQTVLAIFITFHAFIHFMWCSWLTIQPRKNKLAQLGKILYASRYLSRLTRLIFGFALKFYKDTELTTHQLFQTRQCGI